MSPVDPGADERLWLARATAGDRAAFAALVRLHQGRVRAQLRRLAGSDFALADDLAQESFVQAWLHLNEFRGDARFATWLYRIAYRRFLMHLRASADHTADAPREVDEASHHPQPGLSLRIDMDRALAQLPADERAALVHCYHLDLTHDEAAGVLGLPLGTLKSQVARGKARLAERLAAWAPERLRAERTATLEASR
ncbi:MAG: sigma-70 family RNA polymerase sigma factor [Burkholderiales bacterium]